MDENSIYHPSKLIRVHRYLCIFHKTGDDAIIGKIDIDSISLAVLKTIVIPAEDDPDMYYVYHPDQSQLNKINELLPEKQDFDLVKYDYQLECHDVYEYMLKEKP